MQETLHACKQKPAVVEILGARLKPYHAWGPDLVAASSVTSPELERVRRLSLAIPRADQRQSLYAGMLLAPLC